MPDDPPAPRRMLPAVLWMVAWAMACFDAASVGDPQVTCRVDQDCPLALRCVDGLLLCREQGECIIAGANALEMRPDGSPCGAVDGTDICVVGACVTGRCGDGVLDARREDCDDDNNNSDIEPNRCRTNCQSPRCGDGVIDDFESCDGAPEGADGCALCVAVCALGRGDCVDDDDACDCSPEVIVDEAFGLNALLAVAVDDRGLYWVAADQSVQRTPHSGGPSELIVSAPTNANSFITQLLVDEGRLLRVVLDLVEGTSKLFVRNLENRGGVEEVSVDAAAVAVDASSIWVAAFDLRRFSKATLESELVHADAFAVAALAAATDFVVFADDAGVVRTIDRLGPLNVTEIARDQFALSRLNAHDDVVVWNNGDDVVQWRPGFTEVVTLPRVSDGQRGLAHVDVVQHGDTTFLAIDERSDQRPGGIMRLDAGSSTWRQVARILPGRMLTHDGFLYVLTLKGLLRVPLALRAPEAAAD